MVRLEVYDDRSSNSLIYGNLKSDKFLGSRTINLDDFVRNDNHYFVYDYSFAELMDYNRGDNAKHEVRKLAVKLEWRLAKKRV